MSIFPRMNRSGDGQTKVGGTLDGLINFVEAVTAVDTEPAPFVEREDHNNANLKTFEVTWENGAVERVGAHWMLQPSADILGKPGVRHITFSGWYDGQHRTALSVRPDRVRCIRDLGVLPSLPDVDAEPETVVELDTLDGGEQA